MANLHIIISQSYGNPLLTDLDIILCSACHFKGWVSFNISVSTLGGKIISCFILLSVK